eukprot:TRINITY_DN7150_c0_g2_i3.p1 TRINITY_DN7150_c0_g2~~TRINITY_DN7150_c0_g2_i3.p1  ORF type:complete len:223 (+),score=20.26 TRINITY_DN7150_c0_g2_i3:257-925(+)
MHLNGLETLKTTATEVRLVECIIEVPNFISFLEKSSQIITCHVISNELNWSKNEQIWKLKHLNLVHLWIPGLNFPLTFTGNSSRQIHLILSNTFFTCNAINLKWSYQTSVNEFTMKEPVSAHICSIQSLSHMVMFKYAGFLTLISLSVSSFINMTVLGTTTTSMFPTPTNPSMMLGIQKAMLQHQSVTFTKGPGLSYIEFPSQTNLTLYLPLAHWWMKNVLR